MIKHSEQAQRQPSPLTAHNNNHNNNNNNNKINSFGRKNGSARSKQK